MLMQRRQGNHDVDFVIEHRGIIIGLEIKSGRSQQASGLAAFCKECNPYKVLLVGNSGIPWREFLELNPLELFNLKKIQTDGHSAMFDNPAKSSISFLVCRNYHGGNLHMLIRGSYCFSSNADGGHDLCLSAKPRHHLFLFFG